MAQGTPPPQHPPAQHPAPTPHTDPGRWLAPVVAGVLLLIFLVVTFAVVATVTTPPLLADVAPTGPPRTWVAPSDAPTAAAPPVLEPQHRGAFDANARLLALLAVVSPLVTTVVGFYFGQRTGEARAEVAETRSTAVLDTAVTVVRGNGTETDLFDALRNKRLL